MTVEPFNIIGDQDIAEQFLKDTKSARFLFSFVTSYTYTAEIPGITIAGPSPELMRYTPPADAEYLHYGYCKSIKGIPMTPDGKPTPALLTKSALESASIPHITINAGSRILPQLPYIETNLEPGNNIAEINAMTSTSVSHAVDYGRIVGRLLASVTDCLIIGESIPGGTTTALGVLRGLGFTAKTSSSSPDNPSKLKDDTVNLALDRLNSKNPYDVVAAAGDPMIPFAAGMLSAATEISYVMLAGGTQMESVMAFAAHIGFNRSRCIIGTTSYVTNDNTANFADIILDMKTTAISVDPYLSKSKISGLRAYAEGFAKEGVGAGGSIISAILKSGISRQDLLERIQDEYIRLTLP